MAKIKPLPLFKILYFGDTLNVTKMPQSSPSKSGILVPVRISPQAEKKANNKVSYLDVFDNAFDVR